MVDLHFAPAARRVILFRPDRVERESCPPGDGVDRPCVEHQSIANDLDYPYTAAGWQVPLSKDDPIPIAEELGSLWMVARLQTPHLRSDLLENLPVGNSPRS